MAKETEIKLRVDDTEQLQRKLRRLRAKITVPRTFETNVLFDTARAELKKKEQLLRIRSETPAAEKGKPRPGKGRTLLTFKTPEEGRKQAGQERHKTREELELEVSDAEALEKIFDGLELRDWFRYEKYRTTYELKERSAKELKIEVDETPIGMFLELEGPEKAIDSTAEALGYSHDDYIVANYIELYREYCRKRGEKPGQMVFAHGKTRSGRTKSKKVT